MRIFTCLICTFFMGVLQAQPSGLPLKKNGTPTEKSLKNTGPISSPLNLVVPAARPASGSVPFTSIKKLQLPADPLPLRLVRSPKTGLPIFIEGKVKAPEIITNRGSALENKVFSYLESLKQKLQIRQPGEELSVTRVQRDELGQIHVRLKQRFRGVEVFGSEISLHLRNDQIDLLKGRYFATPRLASVEPQLTIRQAEEHALADLATFSKVIPFTDALVQAGGEQLSEQKLVIYFQDEAGREARLAYYLEAAANPLERWAYFIDAQTGAILKKHSLICTLTHELEPGHRHVSVDWSNFTLPKIGGVLDGPATATATDLLGVRRTLNTYLVGNNYFLLDASREMFKSNQSSLPDEPVGSILTADANNSNTSNFEAFHVTSSNNAWDFPTAVSAHYNAGEAYEYFRRVHLRNSINGVGGNIFSFVNIRDEENEEMDNAFWNGKSMFYGNGNTAFKPLAAALDVAGHEMAHGVVQSTANLLYEGEAGALNESFADIFGAMIDRDDWQIGEDVVLRQAFPSGALRDMANPNNGGRRLGDPGWQPAHTVEQYFGDQDNGGVHINSGIHNRAFFLVANQLGRDKAEDIFYWALDKYLGRSDQFIDARLSAIRSAQDLFGATEVSVVASAFDQVGILGDQPTAEPEEAAINEGRQFILAVSENQPFGVYILDTDGNPLSGADPLLEEEVVFKPSISDDGSLLVYINGNNQIRIIQFDWSASKFGSGFVDTRQIWRRVAISKDGRKVAATTTPEDANIYVFDLTRDPIPIQGYALYNPTFTEGVSSGEVQYADGLEWDLTSQKVIYDAINEVSGLGGGYLYADIGFLNAWNNATESYGDGKIEKLFNSLPDGVTIGNPVTAKNSPSIIAFDYYDSNTNDFAILASNVETGDVGGIVGLTNLGFPSYSVDDKSIIYDDSDFFFSPGIYKIGLEDDKINAQTAGSLLASGFKWSNWFGTGSRTITSTKEELNPDNVEWSVFPNPFREAVSIQATLPERTSATVELYNMLGQMIYQDQFEAASGPLIRGISLQAVQPGTYLLKFRAGRNILSEKIVKF